jgi:hypothetical protein
MARERDLKIPLNQFEDEEFDRRCDAAGRARADWARRVLLGFERPPPPPEGFRLRDGRSAEGVGRVRSVRIPMLEEELEEYNRRAEAADRKGVDWARRVFFGIETAPPPPDGFQVRDGRRRRGGEPVEVDEGVDPVSE